MTTSVKYIGAVEPYYETAITGKQNGWRKGQGGDVPDGDATLLVASGLFVLNRSPLTDVAAESAQAATSMSATDAANPTVAGRISSESAAITHATGTGTAAAQAAFTSMDADGFTVTWGTTDGSARKEFYLALG